MVALRAEIPIVEVVLRDGARRYAVDITVDGKPVRAGLDTGSVGLRVLARNAPAGADQWYSYGSGVKLTGPAVPATVAFGGLSGGTQVQAVRVVGCVDRVPECPGNRLAFNDFGIMGDGIPGAGFVAILGIGMSQANLPNPLRDAGARAWIVRLPRPGEAGPGALILNPTPEESAGFVPVPMADGPETHHDAVRACLVWSATFCAPAILDTGAPGFALLNAPAVPDRGTDARVVFGDPAAPVATLALRMGDQRQATRMTAPPAAKPWPSLHTGLTAYFGFDVLYDPDARTVALRPRTPVAGGVAGRLGA